MNHGIARVMDLSIGLHVTSKSGGGGSQKPFPSYSLFCGLFLTPSQSLKSLFLLRFFPFLNLSSPEFFPTLKFRKRTTLFYGKFNPLQSIQSRKRGLIQQCIPIGLLSGSTPRPRQNKTKNFRESINYHRFTFAATFHGKAEVVPPTLAGAGTYLFRLSGYGFRWSRIRVIIKKKKKNGVQSYLLAFCCVMRM